jgi:transketolase
VRRGAYVLADVPRGAAPSAVLIATGSEVALALSARAALADQGVQVRVVSMPSQELFAAQDEAYRANVLPPGVPRVAIEAGHPMSWYRWVGETGAIVGLDHFGASAPADRLFKEFGFTVENVVARVRGVLAG